MKAQKHLKIKGMKRNANMQYKNEESKRKVVDIRKKGEGRAGVSP
jgi:hypothetical protein